MASNFLAKWLGRGLQTKPELDETRVELRRLISKNETISQPAQWLEMMLPDLLDASTVSIPHLSSDIAQAKFSEGLPLLRGEQLVLNDNTYRRWQHACNALAEISSESTYRQLAHRAAELNLTELVASILAGQSDVIEQVAGQVGVGSDLLTTLLRTTVFPDFVAINRAWEEYQQSTAWERGYCPTCGCRPLLGEFRGLEQNRFLRCGWCAASWQVPRFYCSDCGNRDHARLGFFHREEEKDFLRVANCQACGGYLKMVTTLRRLAPIQLWIADLSTLHLDLAAAERGLRS